MNMKIDEGYLRENIPSGTDTGCQDACIFEEERISRKFDEQVVDTVQAFLENRGKSRDKNN